MRKDVFEEVLPLSPLQRGLWFHSNYDSDALDVYVGQVALDFDGDLDVEALHSAVSALTRRQQALRSAFIETNSGNLVQVILSRVEIPWRRIDLSSLTADERSARLELLTTQQRNTRFDLSRPPLQRYVLLRLAPARHRLLITFHHVAMDGWSTYLYLRELIELYELGNSSEPPLGPVQYRDYFSWLARQDRGLAEKAWREALAGLAEPTRVAPTQTLASRVWPESIGVSLTAEMTARLGEIARGSDLTLNAITQAAWATVLARQSRTDDVVFGVTVAGRPAELDGSDRMLGLFINTLPVRIAHRPGAAIIELLRSVHEENARLLTYQHIELSRVQQLAGLGNLFDTSFVFQNYPGGFEELSLNDGTLRVSVASARDQSHFPLSLQVIPGETLGLRLSYRPDLFTPATADSIAHRVAHALTSMAANLERHVGTVSLLSPDDCHRLATAGNDTTVPVPSALVHELFERQCQAAPDRIAISHAGGVLTYAELNDRANRLARLLVKHGAGPDRLVAVLLPRSADLIVALLAVLKSGAGYLPLDPRSPGRRLFLMLAEARPVLALLPRDTAVEGGPSDLPIIALGDPDTGRELESLASGDLADADRRGPITRHNTAYVSYTSGSSGRPKGIVTTHENVVALVADRCWQFGHQERVLVHSPQAFDALTYEVCVPLTLGGHLVIAPGEHFDVRVAGETMRAHGVTSAYLTAKLFSAIAEDSPEVLSGLQEVWTGAEVASPHSFRRAVKAAPGGRFINVYGPTETTVFATASVVTDVEQVGSTVAIGTPMDNTRIYVLDSALSPVPPGVVGEIFIGGLGVARGYLNQPALTAERFVADPFANSGARMYRTGDLAWRRTDGALEFHGRADDQVKVRGFRIELGEIETALIGQDDIARAVVLLRNDDQGPGQLVAYVVPKVPGRLDVADLRLRLTSLLPEYMLPVFFVTLDNLPMNANGKLDRPALPAPEMSLVGQGRAPRSPTEEILCRLTAEVLRVPSVTIDTNLFDLGCDSLSAIKLVSRIRAELGVDLGIHFVFSHPAVSELVDHVEAAPPASKPLLRRERRVSGQ